MGKTAGISLRLNPDIDAKTIKQITTGRSKDKFGISGKDLTEALGVINNCPNVKLLGLHVHVGSQITEMDVFVKLCEKMNAFQKWFERKNVTLEHINMGGGLAIDYEKPLENPISPFETYFETIHRHLEVRKGQKYILNREGHWWDRQASSYQAYCSLRKGREKNLLSSMPV